MTVSTTTSRVDYPGTGSAGPFSYPFQIFADTDLVVVREASSGARTTLALTTDYTVTGVGDRTGGSVTLVEALASGETLILARELPLTQEVDLTTQGGAYYPEDVGRALDRQVMIAQQLDRRLDRALLLPDGSTLDGTLPAPRPLHVPMWNGDGTALTSIALVSVPALADAAATGVVNVRDYGAVGDGVTNDTAAFQAAVAALSVLGGGRFLIPPGVYVVGEQALAGATGLGYAWLGADILRFEDVPGPIEVVGYGATLRFADGMRFGAFDPATGDAGSWTMPFTDNDYRAIPGLMLMFYRCGLVTVRGLELDGNAAAADLGGLWGDTGRQMYYTGLWAYECAGVRVEDVDAHDFGLDGFTFGHAGYDRTTTEGAATPVVMINCRSRYNGRQGVSRVGGRGFYAVGCDFSYTGRGAISSAPGAGIDIEDENAHVDDTVLEHCTVLHNVGVGVLFDTGEIRGLTLRRCLVWGTENYALWCKRPAVTIEDSTIYGSSLLQHLAATPADAYHLRRSLFDDLEHPEYGVGRLGETLNLDGGAYHTLDDVEIVGRGQVIAWLKATVFTPSALRLSGVRFRLAWDGATEGAYVAVLNNAIIERTAFVDGTGASPGTPWYVDEGGGTTFIGPACTAAPNVRFGSTSGASGALTRSTW